MELWFTEYQAEGVALSLKVRRSLHHEVSPYQRIDVLETEAYGRVLLLDGMVMTTERDGHVYSEMLAHVPLVTHPHPERVLIVGGGDGGVACEVLRHASVQSVDLVEIDAAVLRVAEAFFPEAGKCLRDSRVHVHVADGFAFLDGRTAYYDVILVDSTEPVGPAVQLFELAFYEKLRSALRTDGLFAAQTDNPWLKRERVVRAHHLVGRAFPRVWTYLASIPTYPSGLWSFTLGSLGPDPLTFDAARAEALPTRYYTPEVHRASFALPRELLTALREGGEA
ncbi:polyamine aminopropyltransferase [Brockia lithotrophica]|uniref:Polyamine aminopropyltransferase n=1 Tax=Brockia lithotrophica TaxID=933949 RepID=A0A660KWE3_9BACL|nr:polyamine aminopropyltransferase [Brockia lithotrophica]RKQ83869.1 spermidine synthase [Brockia lithotrophica]